MAHAQQGCVLDKLFRGSNLIGGRNMIILVDVQRDDQMWFEILTRGSEGMYWYHVPGKQEILRDN